MDILRFITAGSIDDGKSTLIGRLLYDTGQIKSDIIQSVSGKGNSQKNTTQPINLAHITDGLRSEREQGITIDIAYTYFTTKNRKYIITDAPGHFQYTKNLVTGASEVDAMIILIDAKNGITEQTRRHSLVASFLNIPQILLAINKMDLVDYKEEVFTQIKLEYEEIANKLNLNNISFIPISALLGDNISSASLNMVWYKGRTLIHYLENFKPKISNKHITRFSVQCVINSLEKNTGNCFAGKLLSGQASIGDEIEIYPEKKISKIRKITIGNDSVVNAVAGDNLCLYLENNSEAKRGDMICKPGKENTPILNNTFEATLCWLNPEKALQLKENYVLRINAFETICLVTAIIHKIDPDSYEKYNDGNLSTVNEFVRVIIKTKDRMAYDPFNIFAETGRGILIDTKTNYTSAAFIIEE